MSEPTIPRCLPERPRGRPARLRWLALAIPFAMGISIFMVVGCSAQADTTYQGEPLAELRGTVQNTGPRPVGSGAPPLAAALVWSGLRPGSDAKASVARQQIGSSVAVRGAFPASFSLQVFTPPPASARFSCFDDTNQTGSIATARVHAIRDGADPSSTKIQDFYGQVSDYVVAYADANLPAASDCPVGALSQGYHLFERRPMPDEPGCVRGGPDDPSCSNPWPYVEVPMSTPLTLVLSHDDGAATPPEPSGPPPSGGNTTTTPNPPPEP